MRKLAVVFLTLAAALSAQVTATVSSQGTQVVKMVTGYTPADATLMRIDVCNGGDAASVSTSRVISSIIADQKYGIYGSGVVGDVMTALQAKDVFSRAQKIIGASTSTATLLTALFKTFSPLTVGLLQSAPAIAQAILPAVADQRDLIALSKQILQDGGSMALGKKGSGNDCQTALAVAMSGTPKIAVVSVQ